MKFYNKAYQRNILSLAEQQGKKYKKQKLCHICKQKFHDIFKR